MKEQQPEPTKRPATLCDQARRLAEEQGHVPFTLAHDMAVDEHFAALRREQIESNQSQFETIV